MPAGSSDVQYRYPAQFSINGNASAGIGYGAGQPFVEFWCVNDRAEIVTTRLPMSVAILLYQNLGDLLDYAESCPPLPRADIDNVLPFSPMERLMAMEMDDRLEGSLGA